MPSEESITITKSDLELVLDVERIKTIQEINGNKLDKTEGILQQILVTVQQQPLHISKCRNEIKDEMFRDFLTKDEAIALENRFEVIVGTLKSKLTWTLSTVIAITTVAAQVILKVIGG